MLRIPVTEASHVGEVRRAAVNLAATSGYDETDRGRLAIVVTELANNTLRHGGGGEILVGPDPVGEAGLQVIALDRGPGMTNVSECFRDGYSTYGTPGTGLGAVKRQATQVLVHSVPGHGTVLLARLGKRTAAAPQNERRHGVLSIAKPGETVCGDAAIIVPGVDGCAHAMVADGLGHGPIAAEAAHTAVRLFRQMPSADPVESLRGIHAGLRPTRGAAIAVAWIDTAGRRLMFGGIGNIGGLIADSAGVRRLVSQSGIAGHNIGRLQAFSYEMHADPVVVMYSDGLVSSWSPQAHPGLFRHDPVIIAAVLYRDYARGRDDATVAVWKG